jgi:hypothetical protein
MLLNINKGSPGLRIYRSTWLIVAAVFFSWCAMAGKPTPEAQLATIAATPIALVYIAFQTQKIVFQWREHGVSCLLANLLIVISFWAAVPIGHIFREMIFAHDLDRYNQAVLWVKSHATPNQPAPIKLPAQYEDLAYVVTYDQDATCGLRMDFVWGSGFPVKHVVRRFSDRPGWVKIKECHTAPWDRFKVLGNNWYEISD